MLGWQNEVICRDDLLNSRPLYPLVRVWVAYGFVSFRGYRQYFKYIYWVLCTSVVEEPS